MTLTIQKIMNQKDGSRKKEKLDIVVTESTKKPTLPCEECKKIGFRSDGWSNSLYVCTTVDCDVKFYWKDGVYYV